jgi:hypothetical protein
MPPMDLTGYLRELSAELDKDISTEAAAKGAIEKEREDHLQGFCRVVENDILPVFQEAEASSADNLIIKMTRDELDSISLNVTAKKPGATTLSGLLRYRVDSARKEVTREMQKRGEEKVKIERITPDLLQSEEVKKSVALLANSFRNGKK